MLKAHKKIIEDDTTGVKPMYRSRDWNRKEREAAKSAKRFNWWNTEKSTIKYKSVLFVTPTPGAVLAKDVRKREAELNRNTNERVKIVEKGGLKVKDMLGSKNPFKKTKCEEKACPMCTSSEFILQNSDDIQIPCSTNNVGYRWSCLTCKDRKIIKIYEGETSRSARIRGAEHLKGLQGKNIKNVLYNHKVSEHQNEPIKFKMTITKDMTYILKF